MKLQALHARRSQNVNTFQRSKNPLTHSPIYSSTTLAKLGMPRISDILVFEKDLVLVFI